MSASAEMQDQLENLAGQAAALTKIWMTVFARILTAQELDAVLDTFDLSMRNPALSESHIAGIETVIAQLRAVVQMRIQAEKAAQSIPPKGH